MSFLFIETSNRIGINSGVLVEEMCIFCSTSLSEVFDLHDLWEECDVHGGLGGL